MNALLNIENLDAFYGDFQALFGVSFEMAEAQTVALVGANGAGKSTFLKCLTGLLSTPEQSILFRGENIAGTPSFKIARGGIAMSPEGRRLFPSLSVEENLLLGANVGRKGQWNLSAVHEAVPDLGRKARYSRDAIVWGPTANGRDWPRSHE